MAFRTFIYMGKDMETAEHEVTGEGVKVEKLPGSKVRLHVHVGSGEVAHALDHATRAISRKVKIPGFRPGKAPAPVVERHVGWETIRSEALDHLLNDVYLRVVAEQQLVPVGDPTVESVGTLEKNQELDVVLVVAVRPDVDVAGYEAIRVEAPSDDVTDEEVDRALEDVRSRFAETADVDRPAQAGDVVVVKAVMKRGDEMVGGSEDQEQEMLLDRERLLDGMVDGIVGLKIGDSHTFPVTLPESYPTEELRNVTVDTTVQLVGVKERTLPPLDDALAIKDGHAETLEGLRAHYRSVIENQKRQQNQDAFEQSVVEALDAVVKVDLPEVMVELELDQWLYDTAMRFSQLGIPFERYMEYTNATPEQWKGERRDEATQRVRVRLALDEIAKREGVELDETAVESEVARLAEGQKATSEDIERLRQMTRRQLLRQGALNRMVEIARGEE